MMDYIEEQRGLVESGHVKNAMEYLDELEKAYAKIEQVKRARDHYRTQLADQRAHAIRMMAHDLILAKAARGEGVILNEVVDAAADCYDLLATIPVPPPGGANDLLEN